MHADSTIFGAANTLHTEALSYANFLIAVMESKGLKPETLDEMLSMQSQIPKEKEQQFGDIKGWTLGFAVEPTNHGSRYSHNGQNPGFLAFFMFYQELKRGYVFFASGDSGGILDWKLRGFLGERKE